jgi:carboxyl-terminal processing protease
MEMPPCISIFVEPMNIARSVGYAALILITLAGVFVAGFGTHWILSHGDGRAQPVGLPGDGGDSSPDAKAQFGVFWEAWDILQRDFYGEKPATESRTYGAISGLVESYGDPFTYFVEPEPRQREKEDLSGEFGGIGAWVSQDEDGTIRLQPMADLPAARAGVRDRDILRAVDGTPISPEMSTDDAVSLIRGPVGEPVLLTILREESGETLDIEVIRERIETPTVEWRMLEEAPETGYVTIHLFGERTPTELDRALADLRGQGASQLVLDLRHNPGGLLDGAVAVASRFLNDGVVLFERKSDGTEETYHVSNAERVSDWPMVVLVDGATASAAEIVAGALQDRTRASLVGEKTFGKGSVQLVHDLSDGSSIHVTVAHWLTPNGHEINGVGLTPDLEVAHEDGRDAPLEEAVRLFSSQAMEKQASQ